MISIPLRIVCTTRASAMSDKASAGVKRTLRAKIYQKMLALGTNYSETVATSEAVMLASGGVEQIDTYFARYLPQLFYSLLALLTLFVLLAPVHLRSALVLLVCVPLIPMSIVAVRSLPKSCWINIGASTPAWAMTFGEHPGPDHPEKFTVRTAGSTNR